MAMPKKRMSKVRSGTRRSQIKYALPGTFYCPKCHSPRLPHTVCPVCGTYRGREVVVQKTKTQTSAEQQPQEDKK